MIRYAAMAMAAIAFLGLIVWAATSGDDAQSVAALSGASDEQRQLFHETSRDLYVAPPANAIERAVARQLAQTEAKDQVLTSVAALPPPRRKVERMPSAESVTSYDALPDAMESAPLAAEAQASDEPARSPPATLDAQMSTQANDVPWTDEQEDSRDRHMPAWSDDADEPDPLDEPYSSEPQNDEGDAPDEPS